MNLPNVPEDQPTLQDIAYRFGTVQDELNRMAPDPRGIRHTLAYAELAVADLRKIAEVAP